MGFFRMKKLIISLLMLSAGSASAIVDMKSANYTNSWTDLEVPGSGYDFKVLRQYNSRSLFSGIFGFGWCSEFETVMEILPEGNLRVTECGGGAKINYSPREITKADKEKTINSILTKMKAEKKVGQTETFYKNLQNELIENEDRRIELSKQYNISVPIKEGTKFSANGKEVENIVFNKTHYTRNLLDGSAQRFDLQGRLIAQYDKNGNFLKFEYDKELIKEATDNNGRRLSFKYYPNKKVQKITGPNGLTAEYKFGNLDDLSMVKNSWKNVYTYEYDDLHNLVKAGWPDKTFIAIKYDKIKDWVVGFTDRDKCVETYNYEFAPNDPRNHYWSTVKKVCGKEVIADNRYEFWQKQKANGETYLQRVLSTVGNNTTDIIYHEIFGKPTSIRKNTDRVSFEYYPDGLVKTKANSVSKMNFEYDAQIKKVSEVNITYFNDKGEKAGQKSTQFKYDGKGNLTYAQNSDGQKINMTYDNRGRISSITDHAKKVVNIEYEERFGKPTIVKRPGLGTIKVVYKANGEIQNVESKEGPSVAMQVASTFNNLLDIIAPATAELYL